METNWDEIVQEYQNYLEVGLSIPSRKHDLPPGSWPYRTWKHIETVLELIPQIRDLPEFSNVRLIIWHATLFFVPMPKKTRVGLWYEDTKQAYYVFLDDMSRVYDDDWDDEQLTVPPGTITATLKDTIDRIRNGDHYR